MTPVQVIRAEESDGFNGAARRTQITPNLTTAKLPLCLLFYRAE
jgi:hypothetical protein